MNNLTLIRDSDVLTLSGANLKAILNDFGESVVQRALAHHSKKLAEEEDEEKMYTTDEALEFLDMKSAAHFTRKFKESGLPYRKGAPNRYAKKYLKMFRVKKGSS